MGWKKKGIDDVPMKGRRVLMRVDFNVPLDEGRIADDLRIRAALPAARAVVDGGGRLILMSHLGRPKGKDPALRMDPVAERLAALLDRPVKKVDGCVEDDVVQAARALADGEVMLLENLRFYPEEKKADETFAKRLAALGEVFVGDAFGTAHRKDASVAQVPRFLDTAVAGPLLQKEIGAFTRMLESPKAPFVAVLGGAKVSDKIPVVENLLPRVDLMLVGGGMAYTLLKARGASIGKSKFEEEVFDKACTILCECSETCVDILLPTDHRAASAFEETAEATVFQGDLEGDWMGLDIGPETEKAFADHLAKAGTVVWNGPMGVFEFRVRRIHRGGGRRHGRGRSPVRPRRQDGPRLDRRRRLSRPARRKAYAGHRGAGRRLVSGPIGFASHECTRPNHGFHGSHG
jgi:phosphoglycerate kinase